MTSQARYALAVLTSMNLLNYIDRFVPSAVKDLFKRDLALSDMQTSIPLSGLIIVYMIASPLFSSLSDKVARKHLIAGGVALWSLATAAAAAATGFYSLFLSRALVGVGEAAYGTISPALIGDFYTPDKRNRALTIFYIAIPFGAAFAFLLGGAIGQAYGWRAAFLVCGLPGLAAAALCLRIKDPGLGAIDGRPTHTVGWPETLRRLRGNRLYIITVIGYTLVTFASGGMVDWFQTFLSRTRGFSLDEASKLIGTSIVLGGLGGTIAGGILGDRLKTRQPYLALSGGSMVLSAAAAVVALTAHDKLSIAVGVVLAQFFLWFYNGPINTLLVNSVEPDIRTRAFSLSILSIHLLGDATSPMILGLISDLSTLSTAVAVVPLFMALGAGVWLYGWRKC